jgi:Xaa-Pro aminopeptidase
MAFGVDWEDRIDWARMRRERLEKAKGVFEKNDFGAVLCMDAANIRYVTSTKPANWTVSKPGLRYALLFKDGPPVLFEQGDIKYHTMRQCPWLGKENIRHGYSWIKGAAGAGVKNQVVKFTKSIMAEMEDRGVGGERLAIDFIDHNIVSSFAEHKLHWVDGMQPMLEARAVKTKDEIACLKEVAAICDGAHQQISEWLKPGVRENEISAWTRKYFFEHPGIENLEDVICSSGPNTWPNIRAFSDRIIRPGDIVFVDLAGVQFFGYNTCYYRTYCVGREPTKEQVAGYQQALKWLYDAIKAVKPGATTADVARKFPSAKELWGYEEEEEAAANLWGHGLGLAQYDIPMFSRIFSLDAPVTLKPGMFFALETQQGKMFEWGVRIEEEILVTEDGYEVVTKFPVEGITVCNAIRQV